MLQAVCRGIQAPIYATDHMTTATGPLHIRIGYYTYHEVTYQSSHNLLPRTQEDYPVRKYHRLSHMSYRLCVEGYRLL